jgi:hypothetical protein
VIEGNQDPPHFRQSEIRNEEFFAVSGQQGYPIAFPDAPFQQAIRKSVTFLVQFSIRVLVVPIDQYGFLRRPPA